MNKGEACIRNVLVYYEMDISPTFKYYMIHKEYERKLQIKQANRII